jgi:hypothetical protein
MGTHGPHQGETNAGDYEGVGEDVTSDKMQIGVTEGAEKSFGSKPRLRR